MTRRETNWKEKKQRKGSEWFIGGCGTQKNDEILIRATTRLRAWSIKVWRKIKAAEKAGKLAEKSRQ